jgi:hypothetical protein
VAVVDDAAAVAAAAAVDDSNTVKIALITKNAARINCESHFLQRSST